MNKQQLIRAVAQRGDLTVEQAAQAVNSTLDVITDTLAAGEKVQLVGFGTFEVRDRAPRQTRNPRTQEIMDVPASRAPVFRPGKPLKDTIAGR